MEKQVLKQYSLSQTFSDLTIISGVDESEYPAHKVILSSSSKYIRDTLQENPDAKKIVLPKPVKPMTQNFKSDPTSKLLKISYNDPNLEFLIENGFGRDNCLTFYSLAQSMKMPIVEKIIVDYISENLLNPETAAQYYLESSKFEDGEWGSESLNLISQNFDKIIQNREDYDRILRLPLSAFQKLLKREDVFIDNEDPFMDLVMKYIKMREDKPEHPDVVKAREEEEEAKKEAEEAEKEKEEGGEEGEEEGENDEEPVKDEEPAEEGDEENNGEEEQENPEEELEEELNPQGNFNNF